MTTVVFFDVAGTLIRVRDGVGAQYARVAARFGVVADPKALEREFPRAFRAAPRMAFPGAPAESVPGLEREVWRGIVRDVFAGAARLEAFAPGAFDAYFDAVYRHFEDAATWDVFPDVVPALAALRDMGAALGIVSNFDSRVLRILDGTGPRPMVRVRDALEPGRRDQAGPGHLRARPGAARDRPVPGAPRRGLARRGWRRRGRRGAPRRPD